MTLTHELASVTRHVDLRIEGAPDTPMRHTGVTIRPNWITVTFDDGAFSRAVIRGHNVKKDGTEGVTTHDRSFSPNYDNVPTWVAELVETARGALK